MKQSMFTHAASETWQTRLKYMLKLTEERLTKSDVG